MWNGNSLEALRGCTQIHILNQLCERLRGSVLGHWSPMSVGITLILRLHDYISFYCSNSFMKNLCVPCIGFVYLWTMISREQNLTFWLLENFMMFMSVAIKLLWLQQDASFVWLKCYGISTSREGTGIFFSSLDLLLPSVVSQLLLSF